MATGIKVEALFLGDVEVVLAELACNERIDASSFELADDLGTASGGDADALRLGAPEFDGCKGFGEK